MKSLLKYGAMQVERVFTDDLPELRATAHADVRDWKPQGINSLSTAGPAYPTNPVYANTIKKGVSVLTDMGFPDVRYIASVLIPKWYGECRRPWHLDWWGWENFTDTCRTIPPQIGMLTYMDDAMEDSGALIIMPGSHRRDVHGHSDYWETKKRHPYEVALPAKAGDIVLLDPRTMHAVAPNTRTENRVCLTLWYLIDYSNLQIKTRRTAMQAMTQEYFDVLGSLCPDGPVGNYAHIKKPQFPIVFERINALRHGFTDRDIIGNIAQAQDTFIDTAEIYQWYRAVGAARAPVKILELGVRFGYALIAMASGANWAGIRPELYGVDNEVDGFECIPTAMRTISHADIDYEKLHIFKSDTKNVEETSAKLEGIGSIDVIHVDGDHSPEGIQAELQLARIWIKPNGIILIDDIDTPHIRLAADNLCNEFGISPILLPTLHGLYVIDMIKRTRYL